MSSAWELLYEATSPYLDRHLVIESTFALIILYLLLAKSYNPSGKKKLNLSDREIDELIKEWEPQPLGSIAGVVPTSFTPPVVAPGPPGYLIVDGVKSLNFGSLDFLGLLHDDAIKRDCVIALEKYGCGSCGPRGFYGTIDVHLFLEEALSKFLRTESSIIYSYDVATVSSVIPAFAKRGDLIVCDEGVSYAVELGVQLSRCQVLWFKHNDMADLERVLQKVAEVDEKKQQKALTKRKFIIVEGVYANSGAIVDLPSLVKLKNRYKYRVIMDESVSFGTLGRRGRGCCEHWDVPATEIECLSASMGNALGSIGGFCAGSNEVVEHQRLSGAGYVFSASLPPFNATASIRALEQMESSTDLHARLHAASRRVFDAVRGLEKLVVAGEPPSPIFHLRLAEPSASRNDDEELLEAIATRARADGVAVTVARYTPLQRVMPPPSIRVSVSATHSDADIDRAMAVLRRAVAAVTK